MPFIKKPFDLDEKIKMFERMGSIAAVFALLLVILIETGYIGSYRNIADAGLTAMIVVLAFSLIGSVYFKSKRR